MMGLELVNRGLVLRVALLAALAGFPAAGFISNEALLSPGAGGRSLLQTKKDCPVTFDGANYTIITSQCKGPLYQPALCCEALKDFACPYAIYINDPATNCAATMFSFIHLYGKYPPGLFANTCREGNSGLKCPDDIPQVQPGQEGKSAAVRAASAAPVTMVTAGATALSALIVLS